MAADPTVKAGVEAWQRGDHAAAIAIWQPLAGKNDADALFNLGQAYKLGIGVSLDLPRAQELLERAARLGHLDAQTSLGLLLFQNGNRIAAMRWLKSAAERGEPRALLVYGTALFNGDGVERDPVKAYAYVSRAAAQGLAPAKETLAQMDELIPVEDRQKGVALAMAAAKTPTPKMAKKAPPPKSVFLPKTKVVVAAPKPMVVSPSSGGWRIQLGAFGQRASAEALFRKLSSDAPLAGKQSYLIPVGAVTRLQAGPFESRAAAAAACTQLSGRGQACFPVAGR
ncbi:MAG TPA: SPOR domain-containing protein [Sphingomicrobium sp.]|nr:SPOR domain-containing protein [Sphingomicrobium sp.]